MALPDPIRLTRRGPSGVLALTDPRGGQFFKLVDSVPIGRPTELM